MNHELLVLFDRIDCSLVSVEGIQKIFPFLFGEKVIIILRISEEFGAYKNWCHSQKSITGNI